MGAYYSIPDNAERAIQATHEAASSRDPYWKEVLVIYLHHRENLLKLVIEGIIDMDYSSHSVLYREQFDPNNPEMWETQVKKIIDKFSK